jgi:hypothetical protein
MRSARLFWFAAAGLAISGSASAGDVVKPTAAAFDSLPLAEVPHAVMPAIELAGLALLEQAERADGLPARFALEQPVLMTPDTDGVWEQVDADTVMWRLRVSCPNAVSLNFGFTRFVMPEGGRLYIYETDGARSIRPFTAADNDAHGELWTPSAVGGDVIIEVTLPFDRQHELDLEIGQINTAYRGFGMGDAAGDWDTRSGSCNVDVVCPEGDEWRAEIPSSGVYTVNGVWYCSGALINNVNEDQTPYFLTADHCGVGTGNDQSVVVYWNYENTWCRPAGSGASGGAGDGPLDMFSPGVIFRAGRGASDFTLVEIEDALDPAWELAFSGFDATGADADMAVAIHHPSTDEKRISFEYQATTTTGYLGNAVPGDGTHVRVIDWDVGTTEPGSSGSPLYNQDHRIIGQLHGGYASCSSQTSDWYGKMSVSWDGGTSSSSRLSDWLDPGGTGVRTVDTLWPAQTGMSVRGAGFAAEGARGGPFEPDSAVYTVKNNLDIPLTIDIDADADWLDLAVPFSFVPAGEEREVLVSLNANALAFGNGHYEATVSFVNLTDHDGDTEKTVTLDVGVPVPVHVFDLTTDPGWSTEGAWAHGQPTGGGGRVRRPRPDRRGRRALRLRLQPQRRLHQQHGRARPDHHPHRLLGPDQCLPPLHALAQCRAAQL